MDHFTVEDILEVIGDSRACNSNNIACAAISPSLHHADIVKTAFIPPVVERTRLLKHRHVRELCGHVPTAHRRTTLATGPQQSLPTEYAIVH